MSNQTSSTILHPAAPFRHPSPVPSLLWGDLAFVGILVLGACMIWNFRRGANR